MLGVEQLPFPDSTRTGPRYLELQIAWYVRMPVPAFQFSWCGAEGRDLCRHVTDRSCKLVDVVERRQKSMDACVGLIVCQLPPVEGIDYLTPAGFVAVSADTDAANR